MQKRLVSITADPKIEFLDHVNITKYLKSNQRN